jgi:transcriptional regulator with XRE-family HTH domain
MQIRELRLSLRLSQADFGARVGVLTRGAVSKIESKNMASPLVAIKIADLSGGKIRAEEISPKLAAIAQLKGSIAGPRTSAQ